jgi:hypothetical protein
MATSKIVALYSSDDADDLHGLTRIVILCTESWAIVSSWASVKPETAKVLSFDVFNAAMSAPG